MMQALTKSVEETHDFASAVSRVVQPRDLVLLVGEIGAGKTTFAQGFGRGLGIDGPITSPTFVLLRTYPAKLSLHHVDIYRLDHLQEVIDLGLMELLDEGGVALVEWGDLAVPVLPHDYLEIHISLDESEESRMFTLRGVGNAWSLRERVLSEYIDKWLVDHTFNGEMP